MKSVWTDFSDMNFKPSYLAVFAGLTTTILWFALTWRYGFDLADEGYYWYGAQRVLRGEVPMLDFMSYDIGRYYWAAAIMRLIGDDGIFGARISAAIYQALGTCLGVYVCLISLRQNGVVRWLFALLTACVLTVWVWPYYKVFDHATSILIVAMLVLMVKIPRPAAWLMAGIGLGFSAMMGRNHGLYGAVASSFVILMLLFKSSVRRDVLIRTAYFATGVVIGFSPTFVMMLTVDGFSGAFIESIASLLRYGATNIGLPIPWPWSENITELGFVSSSIALLSSFGFVLLLAFPPLCVMALHSRRINLTASGRIVLVAALAAAVPYAHYAFSRADVTHLALGIFPVLIGLLVLGTATEARRPIFVGASLLAVSIVALGNSQFYLAEKLFQKKLIQANVGSELLWMSPRNAARLEATAAILAAQPAAANNFLAQPDMPGLYAIYRTKIPLWEIYSLIPMTTDFQKFELSRLDAAHPGLILLSDHDLDGHPELRYSRTHPLIHQWIDANYQPTHLGDLLGDTNFKVYIPKVSVVERAGG